MSGRLYLHLGPPKTATTSLQIALRDAGADWFFYGGAAQPSRDRRDLASRLHSLCLNGWDEDEAPLEAWRADVAAILAEKDLLISEELLLVDGAKADWSLKLARLPQILRGFEVTALICVREPLEALRSLYQELYSGLGLGQKISFETFLASHQAKVFDYAVLKPALLDARFSEVRAFHFDDLVSERLRFSDLFSTAPADGPISVPRVNVSATGRSADRRRLGAIRMRDFAPLKAMRRTGALDRLRALRVICLVRAFSSVPIRGEVEAELPIPAARVAQLTAAYEALLASLGRNGGRLAA